MEAVAWLAGEHHTDHPKSASPVIAAFCRVINDRVNDAERQRLVVYLPRLVGTKGGHDIELRRTMVVADWAVREAAPAALRIAGLVEEADRLAQLAPVTDEACAKAAEAAAAAAAGAAIREAAAESARARLASRASRTPWSAREAAALAAEAVAGAEAAEAARAATAEAATAAWAAGAAWVAGTPAEAAAQGEAAAEAAVAAWAAAAYVAAEAREAPPDWTAPLERMLSRS